MSCNSCGGGKKIIIDRISNPALRNGNKKTILRPRSAVIKKIRPFNNIDKRV